MKKADVVVIGGSAAGVPAAISSRRRYPEKSVVLIRKEERVLIPCGIPYIFGTVGSPENNLVPDAILSSNGIELFRGEAEEINREKKTVSIAGGETISYEKLVLATGSLPIILPIPGVEKDGVFTVRKDVAYLHSMLNAVNAAKDIVIIGGGFIGVEFADECRKNREVNVTVVEMLPHCLQLALDDEFCIEVEGVLTDVGIKLFLNSRVEAILGNNKVSGVKLADGQELKADVVIMGIGMRPNAELAKKAGLEIGPRGTISVDRHMRTATDPDIFACGDCAGKVSFFDGKPSGVMLASVATAEARMAGANLFSTRHTNCGTTSVFSTMLNGRAFAVAGLTERAAKEAGYNVGIGVATATDTHPGGMPMSTPTKVKLIFSKDNGVILGGGISGGKGVGELVNVVSAAVLHMMTCYDITVFQMGTHPALTASPIAYQLVNAAELAAKEMR